jgi:hypothetical protein
VIADALDDGDRPAVAHGKSLAGDPAHVRLATVAPYSATLPMITFLSGAKRAPAGGRTISRPPESPLPK